jgi:hypothetical protein
MRLLLIGALLATGGLLVARSPLGLRLGNELRDLSDKVMLATLQLSSEFEQELEPASGGGDRR